MAFSKITKINLFGVAIVVSGISAFFVVKELIYKQRAEAMKVRQRIERRVREL